MPDGSVLGSLCAIDGEERDWSPEDISALWDLAQIAIDEIMLRLEIAKHREFQSSQMHERELHYQVQAFLANVQSMVDMSGAMTTSLIKFRDALMRLPTLPNQRNPNGIVESQSVESTIEEDVIEPAHNVASNGETGGGGT
jgi:hypothetical protein